MRDRINVDKALMPYSFDILLGSEWFGMEFHHNEMADLFTVTLSRDSEVLVYNEPLVYGRVLFADLYQSEKYPALDICPIDESGQETEITFDNFGETIFLCVMQGETDE